jgi:hypothetical protein
MEDSRSKAGLAYRSLSSVRRRFPGVRKNTLLHIFTLIRWCTRGVRQRDGTRLRLQAIRVSSNWYTTDHWVDEFIAVLTAAHIDPEAPVLRSPAQRNRASESAAAELATKYRL